jgi:two-component system LytT family sensor kinase
VAEGALLTQPEQRRGTVRIALIAAAAWLLITLSFAVPEYILSRLVGRPESWQRVVAGVGPHYAMWALFALLIVFCVVRFPIESGHRMRVLFYAALGIALYFCDGAISDAIMPRILNERQLTPEVMRVLFIRAFYDDLLLYAMIVISAHLVRFERMRAALQREFGEAQLRALRTQIQPHFLFNTLNSISELLHVDADAADRMIVALSDLLRRTLDVGETHELALRDELQFLELYLSIQQVRFSDSVRIEREVDPRTLDARVPTLFLQPLVENTFRHGLAKRRRDGQLSIRSSRENGRVVIEICDNGGGLAEGWAEGIGLRNTRVRLQQLYGDAQELTISNRADGGVAVRIVIPYRAVPS